MTTFRITLMTLLAGSVTGGVVAPLLAHMMPGWEGHSDDLFVVRFLESCGFYAECVGIVILPVCLFIVSPIVRFLPRRFPLAHPFAAAFIGGFVGVLAVYLCHLLVGQMPLSWPSPWSSSRTFFYLLAVAVGGVSGLTCSLLSRRAPSPNNALQRTEAGGRVGSEFIP